MAENKLFNQLFKPDVKESVEPTQETTESSGIFNQLFKPDTNVSFSSILNNKNSISNFTDTSLGTVNTPKGKLKTFTSEIDDILSSNAFTENAILKPSRNIKYAYLESSAGFYNLLSNIPGGINRFSNFIQGETSKTPEELLLSDNESDELNLLEKTEKYLKTVGLKVAPKGEADDGVLAKIYQGIGAAPITVGEYIPAIKGAGIVGKAITKTPVGKALNKVNEKYLGLINPASVGMAATDFVMESDKGLTTATTAGAKGFILGNALRGTEALNMKTRATTLGVLGFGSTEGNFEDRISGGVTFAFLGAMGNIGGKGGRDIVTDFRDSLKFRKGVLEGQSLKEYNEFAKGFDTEIKNQERFLVDLLKKKEFIDVEINNALEARKKGEKSIDDKAIETLKKQSEDLGVVILANKDFFKTQQYLNIITKEKKDIRNSTEARSDLYILDEANKKKAKYEDLDGKTVGYHLGRFTLPGKFLNKHPVTKWIVDRTDTFRIRVENKFDTIIKGSGFKEKDYSILPINKDFSFVPGVKLSQKVNSKDSFIEVAKTLTKDERIGAMQKAVEIEQRYLENPKDKIFDKDTGNIKAEELSNTFGMNSAQQLYYTAIRNMVERVRNDINGQIKATGLNSPLIGRIPNYIPHVWFGDYRIFANKTVDGKKQLMNVYGAESLAKAESLVKELKKADKDIEYDISAKKEYAQDPSSVFSEAMMYLKNDGEATKAINSAYLNWIRKNAPQYVMKRRKDKYIKGFAGTEPLYSKEKNLDNFEKGILQFVEGGIYASEKMKLNRDVTSFLELDGVARNLYPNAYKVAKGYLDNAFSREKSAVSKTIDNLAERYLKSSGGDAFIGGLNRLTLTTKLLAYNLRFIAAQLIQPYQMIVPQLHRLNSLGGKGDPIGAVFYGFKEMFNPSKEGKEFFKYLAEQRTVEAKFLDEFRNEDMVVQARIPTKTEVNKKGDLRLLSRSKLWEYATGKTLSAKVEMFSRAMSALMFRKYFIDSGLSVRDANRNASYMANKYMVEYNRFERPKIYGESGVLGYVGKSAGLFKTFQHNFLAQMVEHIQTAKKTGDIRGLSAFTASMIFYAGSLGIVGIGAADYLITKINQYAGTDFRTPTMFLMDAGLPDWALFGVPSVATDTNITSTVAAPDLSADQLFSFPSLEYVGKIVTELTMREGKIHLGIGSPKDSLKVLKAAAPSSLHGLIELFYNNLANNRNIFTFKDMFEEGKETTLVIDMNNKDRGKYERDLDDWVKRLLITTTTVQEAKYLKSIYVLTKMKSNSNATIDNYVTFAAHNYMSRGFVPHVYRDYMLSKGFTESQLIERVKNRIKLMNTSMLDRMRKGDLTPRNMDYYMFLNQVNE